MSEQAKYTKQLETIGGLSTWLVEPVEREAVDALVVLMHGYGAPRDNLVDFAMPILQECVPRGLRPAVAFPGAPIDLSSLGIDGAAWWPLNMAALMQAAQQNRFDEMRWVEPPGVDKARTAAAEAIAALLERYQLPPSRLILGGFSQGAMISMDLAARGLPSCPPLLIICSGGCICEEAWRAEPGRWASTVAVQTHGRFDPILPLQTGHFLRDILSDQCRELIYHEHDGGHNVDAAGLRLVSEKIAEVVEGMR